MKNYHQRIADSLLNFKLHSKGAVLIEGPKWCGKTTTALQIAKSSILMQDQDNLKDYLELAQIRPSALLQGETPHLIDEWQIAPQLFDAIRYEIDKRDEFGQFILTGSATPYDISKINHTGTGRISRMTMRTMSLFESGESNGTVSLKEIFDGNTEVEGTSNIDLSELSYLICRGGWPKVVDIKDQRIALQQAIDYYDGVINSDISRVDDIKRDPNRAARVLRSYARNIASQAKLSSITQDIKSNEEINFSDDTVSSYIKALKSIFVIEDSNSWNPNLRSKAAIRTTDTRYFLDPSIACAALGIGPQDLENDLNTFGLLFENLVVRDLRIYADAIDGKVYHYRDNLDLECDAVVHLRNGKYGLIEVKLGGEKLISEGIKSLNKLEEKLDTTKMKAPAFKMVITGVGKFAYKNKDG
ncbi:MAG: ATP-binding protein, partial [Succinivibrio sp.]|nr:ATP-binding protein [Succinivibrio sp.]